MKFHAYPKLLLAVGSLTLSALGGSAAFAMDKSDLAFKRTSPAAATIDDRNTGHAAQKNLLNLMGKPSLSTKAAVCGDSEPDDGEECDDGNLANGDGCSATCTVEAGSDCTAAIPGSLTENVVADPGFELNDGSWAFGGTILFGPRCSEGNCGPTPQQIGFSGTVNEFYLWLAGGFADPGGNNATATQTVVIPTNASTLTFEWALLATPETCETATDRLELTIDGNVVWSSLDETGGVCGEIFPAAEVTIDLAAEGLNDGLSHTIVFTGINQEGGNLEELTTIWMDNVAIDVPAANPIPPIPSSCLVGDCGDGIQSSGEYCDDGNTAGGDGCSANCRVELDFVCTDPAFGAFDFLPNALGEPANPQADAIVDGSLEDNRGRPTDAWEQTTTSLGGLGRLPICSEVTGCDFFGFNISSDGVFFGVFGASPDPVEQTMSQTVTIPAGADELTFDFFVAAPDDGDPNTPAIPCGDNSDTFEVTVDGTQVFLYDCADQIFINEYTEQTADISAFADGLDHELVVRGTTNVSTGLNTNFFADNFSIAIPGTPDPLQSASVCTASDAVCGFSETFDNGIPASWTVVNLSPDPADGWGTTGDGTCLAGVLEDGEFPGYDAGDTVGDVVSDAYYGNNNLTTGTGGAACADSDATGRVDVAGGGTATEMDTYLCTPELDLSNITLPGINFFVNYQAAGNAFNENGTPDNTDDDFDDDLLEVLVGTQAPNGFTVANYERAFGVNDHEDEDLLLSGSNELGETAANLIGTSIEGEASGYVCFRYRGTFDWFAQIDNVALRGDDCNLPPEDSDGDGVFDSTDNCTDVPNTDQNDTNFDGIGNACDADVTNNCLVNFQDIALFPPKFNTAVGDAEYDENFDLNNSGNINFLDYIIFTNSFNQAPGPSANACRPGIGL